ncbi:MAG: zinc transporter ZntB [Rhodospirillales bacterium]
METEAIDGISDSPVWLDGLGGTSVEADRGGLVPWYRLVDGHPNASRLLQQEIALDSLTAQALLMPDTRPRCTPHGDGALLILRGTGAEPGSDPEELVSIRLWVDAGRIVTYQFKELEAVAALRSALDNRGGPKGPGDFVVLLAHLLNEGMRDLVDEIDAELDSLEDVQVGERISETRQAITNLRRKVVKLRRFIGPQRDALGLFLAEPFSWRTKTNDRRLRDVVDRITRLVEQLDEIHLRASIAQESLTGLVAERLNRTMLLLSVVAGIFLPLGFVTGLLGMNVAGIPGASWSYAFLAVAALLVLVGLIELLLLWRFRLL